MTLLLLLACTDPLPGTYLVETVAWSTTCAVGGGGFVEPAPQYQVEVYVEAEGALWLDDNACAREGFAFTCADEPVVQSFMDGDASGEITVRRAWDGEWAERGEFSSRVEWASSCEGEACGSGSAELCGATWEFTGLNVEAIDGD